MPEVLQLPIEILWVHLGQSGGLLAVVVVSLWLWRERAWERERASYRRDLDRLLAAHDRMWAHMTQISTASHEQALASQAAFAADVRKVAEVVTDGDE